MRGISLEVRPNQIYGLTNGTIWEGYEEERRDELYVREYIKNNYNDGRRNDRKKLLIRYGILN